MQLGASWGRPERRSESGSGFRFGDGEALGEDEAEGGAGCGAVVFLLAFGEADVINEARMRLQAIVALGAEAPALLNAALHPFVVDAARHLFGEF